MARYRDLRRMVGVGDNLVLGASGEFSDFQHITEMLDDITSAVLATHSPPALYLWQQLLTARIYVVALVRAEWMTWLRKTVVQPLRRHFTNFSRG